MASRLPAAGSSKFPLSDRYRDAGSAALLSELEAWRWDRTELDADVERDPANWDHPDGSRAFIDAHIDAIMTELQRREQLRFHPTAPAWPNCWPDHRPDAAAVKAALSIPAYLAGRGVRLERRGERFWGRCPLPGHQDDSPSFVVYRGDAGWYCFGCHRGGDLYALHMHLTGDDNFAAAVAALAADAGLPIGNRPGRLLPHPNPSASDSTPSVNHATPRPPAPRRASRRLPAVEFVGGKVVVR